MTASFNKQAAKMANKAIKEGKATLQAEDILKRQHQSWLVGETEGRDAFNNLRRKGGNKLSYEDVEVIARHLHDEIRVLKQRLRTNGMGIGEFCIRYGISDASNSSKELHRLILAPGKRPADIRLRRSAGKYRSLIEAISKITNESVSALTDRVLFGTSLHPTEQKVGRSEAQIVQTTLQRIVDMIDDEFGLYEKFMETAQQKANHVANGGTEYWPMVNYSVPISDPIYSSTYKQDRDDALDPRFAYWPSMAVYDLAENALPNVCLFNRVLQDSNFFYVPHVPLGVVEIMNLPARKKSITDYEAAVRKTLEYGREASRLGGKSWVAGEYSIQDEWDPDKQCPTGQIGYDKEILRGTNFAWLIIYPTQDGSRLMPMFYIAYEEGGPYILPLSVRSLEIFRDAIWFNETEHMSVFDRIKELLGYRPGTPRVIEDGFRRTAPWFDRNPFYKMKQQCADELQMLDTFCQQLWEKK